MFWLNMACVISPIKRPFPVSNVDFRSLISAPLPKYLFTIAAYINSAELQSLTSGGAKEYRIHGPDPHGRTHVEKSGITSIMRALPVPY